jgi:hypothetical protein
MTTKVLGFLMLTAAFFASCKSAEKGTKTENVKTTESKVPYTVANRYFVKNTFEPSQFPNPKISSQEEFDALFGAAAVMGADGSPTPIDFSKQFVIAVTTASTDKATAFSVNSLTKKDNIITLSYKMTVGEKQSFTMRPVLILIVDNKYSGEVVAVQQ